MRSENESGDLEEFAYGLETPVLLIAFNRPVETAQVIATLREVKARKIYFAVDGPRVQRHTDLQLITETQKLVSHFDWVCDVQTRFMDTNLGCGLGVSSAISWAFTNEEQLIILEDDIVPSLTFFRFCEELLEMHKDNDRVFSISGSNFVPESELSSSESYRFSNFPHVWGWATWKRSWNTYDLDISGWRSSIKKDEFKSKFQGSVISFFLWSLILDRISRKEIDTWDYQLCLAQWRNQALSIISNKNLTKNIGFTSGATHTTESPRYIIESTDMQFPLTHPDISLAKDQDLWTLQHAHDGNLIGIFRSVVRHTRKKIRSVIRLRR